MRIAIVGAGAIGGFLAAALAQSGHDVGIVARGEHLNAIARQGLRVASERFGDFTAAVEAVDDLRKLRGVQTIFATFKAHQWQSALPQFDGYARTQTTLVTMQNGLPFWYFRDRPLRSVDPAGDILRAFDYGQIVGGVVHSSARIVEPGLVAQSGDVHYPIGEISGAPSARVNELSSLLAAAGLRAPVQADIRRSIWIKLVGNAALNPVSALTRARVKSILTDSRTRSIVRSIMQETIEVAGSVGIDIGMTVDERLQFAADTVADVETSMLQDVQAGRPLELDPIVGAVVELADANGMAIPHVRTVYALTKLLAKTC